MQSLFRDQWPLPPPLPLSPLAPTPCTRAGLVSYTELAVADPIAVAVNAGGAGLAWLRPIVKVRRWGGRIDPSPKCDDGGAGGGGDPLCL